jgi:DNA polymerase I-like protein with 3'-5' exonuclease and polymerase domains
MFERGSDIRQQETVLMFERGSDIRQLETTRIFECLREEVTSVSRRQYQNI